ncbi:MAG: hypothetical protein QG633_21 [Patescibacteria group bacterium]|nr:hypothetical protein [Patescibacteria group bacterium]
MVFQNTGVVVANSLQTLWVGVIGFIPELIVALIIFVIGWIIASLLARAVEQVIAAVKLDSALRGAGVEATLTRAGFTLNSGRFLGALVKWFIIVVFLVAALDVLHLDQVTMFLRQVVLGYLPQVIVAVLIMLVAVVIAEAMRKVVVGSAKAAGIRSAGFLGAVTKWAIWIFALLAALLQLGIAVTFLQTLFTGVVVALSLAFGLAFGLGGQSAASRYLDHLQAEMKDRD